MHISLLSPGGINTKPELLVMNNELKGFAKATILEADYVAKTAMDGMLKGKKKLYRVLRIAFWCCWIKLYQAF